MQKLMGVLTLSMIVMSLWSFPAVALTGQIDGGVQVNQAICVNSTASYTSTVDVTGTTFDCGVDFPAAPGDQITIVLVATGGTGPDSPCNTTPIPEQEPNDDPTQSQNIGTLQSGGCITVAGSTDTGFGSNPDAPDPNADIDNYLFSLVGVSRLRIDVDLAVGQTLLFGVFDADTGAELVPQFPEGGGIEVDVPVQTNRIRFPMRTDVPDSYTLTFSDRSGTGAPPLGALTRGLRLIEQHP
jgi:hypothetical protein